MCTGWSDGFFPGSTAPDNCEAVVGDRACCSEVFTNCAEIELAGGDTMTTTLSTSVSMPDSSTTSASTSLVSDSVTTFVSTSVVAIITAAVSAPCNAEALTSACLRLSLFCGITTQVVLSIEHDVRTFLCDHHKRDHH